MEQELKGAIASKKNSDFFRKSFPLTVFFANIPDEEKIFRIFFQSLCRISKRRTDIPYDENIPDFFKNGSPL